MTLLIDVRFGRQRTVLAGVTLSDDDPQSFSVYRPLVARLGPPRCTERAGHAISVWTRLGLTIVFGGLTNRTRCGQEAAAAEQVRIRSSLVPVRTSYGTIRVGMRVREIPPRLRRAGRVTGTGIGFPLEDKCRPGRGVRGRADDIHIGWRLLVVARNGRIASIAAFGRAVEWLCG